MDQSFTDLVIKSMGPNTSPKMRRILTSLIQHMHDFFRENEITTEEWMEGVKFINAIGKMSDDKRDEGILVTDVFGLESLADTITHELADSDHTATAIIGPFYRENSPVYKYGESIIQKDVGGDKTIVHGRVTDVKGNPLKNAKLEVWHTAPNGLYEQQDDEQPDYNLRGTFFTDDEGKYAFIALRPTPYPIPYDGPAGKLLQLMDRHPMRPAHIHWRVTAPGYRSLITQIYDRTCKYVEDDSVFAVKGDLVVDFQPGTAKAKEFGVEYELSYDIALITEEAAAKEAAKRLAAQQEREAKMMASSGVAHVNGNGTTKPAPAVDVKVQAEHVDVNGLNGKVDKLAL